MRPARIVFNDHRRFGLMTLVDTEQLEEDKLFKDIGIEPLSDGFNTDYLARGAGRARKRRSSPPCWTSGWSRGWAISMSARRCSAPAFRPSGWRARSSAKRSRPLVAAIKKVLKDAIAAGGSTLRDHAQATGDPGNFQHHFLVYGREGKPCKNKVAPGQ